MNEPISLTDRIAHVRAAKRLKELTGSPPTLTLEELDLVLPAVPCLRTTLREREMSYREYSRREWID